MAGEFQVNGRNGAALFTLKLHRGEGMLLIAMNWKKGRPPNDFVGFAIEYMEPGGDRFFALKNRLGFTGPDGKVRLDQLSTLQSPIQKFRWVHFPRNADFPGNFVYRVTPVFMNTANELSYGAAQEAKIELQRETYAGRLNVAFTRGFVSSQAFVDRYASTGDLATLLPSAANQGLVFTPTHPKTAEALPWMGFEARSAILELLDEAITDKADVRVVAYDLSEPEVANRLEKIGKRLKIIIDDSDDHIAAGSGENQAAARLVASAGAANVKRQHLLQLQHNKTIVVNGPKVQKAVCGSTNFSWRGFYVQNNNAVVVRGKRAIKPFLDAFDNYWTNADSFGKTPSAEWTSLGLTGIDASVAFSPHAKSNALLKSVAADIAERTKSSLFYSLAFLYQTPGAVQEAIKKVTGTSGIFVYGLSDKKVGGLELQQPDGNLSPVRPAALTKNVPAPFKAEPSGGGGIRLHHKFVVIDFNKPSARVYLGSYNFSATADTKNGENLLLIRNRRIAVAYMIEALRIFDHYRFRVVSAEARQGKQVLALARPPRTPAESAWWTKDYTIAHRILDRELFA